MRGDFYMKNSIYIIAIVAIIILLLAACIFWASTNKVYKEGEIIVYTISGEDTFYKNL